MQLRFTLQLLQVQPVVRHTSLLTLARQRESSTGLVNDKSRLRRCTCKNAGTTEPAENIMFTVYVYYMSANVTLGVVIALTKVVLETEIFRHRYLKYNNCTAKQYFTANFCGSLIDIFKIQCT